MSSWPPAAGAGTPPPAAASAAAPLPEQRLHAHLVKEEAAAAESTQETKPRSLFDDSSEAEIRDHEEKINRYQAILARRLKAKYFSNKTFDGGNVFEEEITIENETIKASRWPCTSSFADPARFLHEKNNTEKNTSPSVAAEASAKNNSSCLAAEASLVVENSATVGKKQPSKKSS